MKPFKQFIKEDSEDDILTGMGKYEEDYMPVFEFSNWGAVRGTPTAILRFRRMAQFTLPIQERLKRGETISRVGDIFTTDLDEIVKHVKKDSRIEIIYVSDADNLLYNRAKEKLEKQGIIVYSTDWF